MVVKLSSKFKATNPVEYENLQNSASRGRNKLRNFFFRILIHIQPALWKFDVLATDLCDPRDDFSNFVTPYRVRNLDFIRSTNGFMISYSNHFCIQIFTKHVTVFQIMIRYPEFDFRKSDSGFEISDLQKMKYRFEIPIFTAESDPRYKFAHVSIQLARFMSTTLN